MDGVHCLSLWDSAAGSVINILLINDVLLHPPASHLLLIGIILLTRWDHNMLLDARGDVQQPFTSSPAKEPRDLCTLIYMAMWQKRCDDLSRRKGEQKGHSRREWALIDAVYFLILGDTFKHDVAEKSKFGKVRKLGTKAIRFNFKIYCILFRVHKLFISVIAQQHKRVDNHRIFTVNHQGRKPIMPDCVIF